ncbi:hypothetical protein E6C27_scaffold24G004460 [Cucumis melo var. makuwa]|uniref:Uncharacterized protein n=1 Tax=Cucumis melo var. makuwa TaxID=1194695 RepID=A0A5A7UMG4_CUCMM|nr:hypothetical protein E6C27_scaffold24G004460 [Cucumis melo var. makuwa]
MPPQDCSAFAVPFFIRSPLIWKSSPIVCLQSRTSLLGKRDSTARILSKFPRYMLAYLIRVLPTWVSFGITTYLRCGVLRDRQFDIDIDMIRVIRRDRSQPDCLSISSGYATDQFVLGVPLDSPKTRFCSYGITCCTCSKTCQFLGRGRGKGKGMLASDQK